MKQVYAIVAIAAGVMISMSANAQSQTKLNLLLQRDISNEANQGKSFDLYLRGEVEPIINFVEERNGLVKRCSNERCAVRLPATAIPDIDLAEYISSVGYNNYRGYVLNDTMRVNDSIVQVHNGDSPLFQPYLGDDVIIGIIDAGIDPNHPDFQDADGNTRIINIWDQREAKISNRMGYGRVYDSTDINMGLYTQPDEIAGGGNKGHGTAVTGIAAGNGLANNDHIGAAPNAKIVVVASDFTAMNWTATIADAVEYCFTVGDSLGLPVVVNASLGSYLGSHDGRDDPALDIDAMINAKEGRIMVCAAGNSGKQAPYHVHTNSVAGDTTWTWFEPNPSSPLGANGIFIEAWADTADFKNIEYAIGADQITPTYDFRGNSTFRDYNFTLNTVQWDTLWNGPNRLAVMQSWAEHNNGVYMLQVAIWPDTTSYNYRFMTKGNGQFDIWSATWLQYNTMPSSGLPTPAQLPDINSYSTPDTLEQIVSSWTCSDDVITVGSYQNRNSWIDYDTTLQVDVNVPRTRADASSRGPTRDLRQKPDLSAAGHTTFAALRLDELANKIIAEPHRVAKGGWHFIEGGTSMASPQVAGAVALYLSRCPWADHDEIKSALTNSAYTDAHTWGSVPNVGWGYGKLNAIGMMQEFSSISIFGDTEYCPGDSGEILGFAGQTNYLWNTGDTTRSIWVSDTDPYYLIAYDGTECKASNPVSLTERPLPAKPSINRTGNTLTSSAAISYQWYVAGNAIAGAINQNYVLPDSGHYYVEAFDIDGCSNFSDTTYYSPLTIEEEALGRVQVYPNPSNGELYLQFEKSTQNINIELFNLEGKSLIHKNLGGVDAGMPYQLKLHKLEMGMYMIRISDPEQQVNIPLILR